MIQRLRVLRNFVGVFVPQGLVWLLRKLIWLYQISLRVVIGPRCRYFPSCSEYASEALEQHGLFHGSRLAVGRLCRCRPGGGSGLDPVPTSVDQKVF